MPALHAAEPPRQADANTASRTQLEAMGGVGSVLAGRILAERRKASFLDWGDFIRRVKGVGPASAARLSDRGLRINGRAYEDDATAIAPARLDDQALPAASLKP